MLAAASTKTGQPLDRTTLDGLLRRRLFYTPSFDSYGGVSGLYDYGPPGCALQANIIDCWRKHFVLEEDMLEVDCTILTPYDVLKTSGHVDKFADSMCKDLKTGEIFRADHLVEEVLAARLKGDREARGLSVAPLAEDDDKKRKKKKKVEDVAAPRLEDEVVTDYEATLAKIDNYDTEGLASLIAKYQIKSPTSGNDLGPPSTFNLMFSTSIGPSSNLPGFLRPETAQGQFLTFSKLLEFNNQQMPFASASIGKSFRNEISPKSGLLRVREFLMAEIEHFVDPEGGKKHPRFSEIKDLHLPLLDRNVQMGGSTKPTSQTVGEAVATGTIDNETLGYFLARIYKFLVRVGADAKKLRFRQHMANEMAHYATDCWDAELFTSFGWIECVGCADRSAYDLTSHMKKTGAPLLVRQQRSHPLRIEEWQIELDRRRLGPLFRKDAPKVEQAILNLSQSDRERLAGKLGSQASIRVEVPGLSSGTVELRSDLIKIEFKTRFENVREFVPNVIEPSFGIGRILYSVMEHVYWTRVGDEARAVLSFPPAIAPNKVLLVPLSGNPNFEAPLRGISAQLRRLGISHRTDSSGVSIGRRYSRNDELGTALGITVDFQTLRDKTITLRERDSTEQVRGSPEKVIAAVSSLISGSSSWNEVRQQLPLFEGQELESADEPDQASKEDLASSLEQMKSS